MNTAIDFYNRGKEREAAASEYTLSNWYPRGRFICPICGEEVHLSKSKYRNFFSHYKKGKETAECERRVDAPPRQTIYESIGLPLFLSKMKNDSFELYMSFRSLPSSLLEDAEKSGAELILDKKNRFRINNERFSCSYSYWLPIDYAPETECYSIEYNGNDRVNASLRDYWGNYAEGFFKKGALFKSNNNSGRKLHKGDVVSMDTAYYWAVKKGTELPKLHGVEAYIDGILRLSNYEYSVYQVVFNSSIADSDFEELKKYLLKEFKLHLLEKEPAINIIWPPVLRKRDRIVARVDTKTLFGVVQSGNETPLVYGYYQDEYSPNQIICKDQSVISIPLKDRLQYFSVDRKNVSTGIEIEKNTWETSINEAEPQIVIDGQGCDYPGVYETSLRSVQICSTVPIEAFVLRDRGVSYLEKSKAITIELKEKTSYALLFNGAVPIISIVNSKSEERSSQFLEELFAIWRQYSNTYSVTIPIRIRTLISRCDISDSKVIADLNKNRIPIVALRFIERQNHV